MSKSNKKSNGFAATTAATTIVSFAIIAFLFACSVIIMQIAARDKNMTAKAEEHETAQEWEIIYTNALTMNGIKYFAYKFNVPDKDKHKEMFDGIKAEYYSSSFTETENGIVVYVEKYDNLTDYYIRLGITGFEKNGEQKTIDDGAFYKVADISVTVKKELFTNNTVTRIAELYKQNGAENIIYKYEYVTRYGTKKVNGQGAEVKKYASGETAHIFTVENPTEDTVLGLSQKYANAPMWYTVVLVPCVLLCLGAVMFGIIYNKRKK